MIQISLITANVNLITKRLHHPPEEITITFLRWLLIKLRLMLSNDVNLKFMCESSHNIAAIITFNISWIEKTDWAKVMAGGLATEYSFQNNAQLFNFAYYLNYQS